MLKKLEDSLVRKTRVRKGDTPEVRRLRLDLALALGAYYDMRTERDEYMGRWYRS